MVKEPLFNPVARKRYLMAVVYLDLTGYTRLMAKSEAKALGILGELESLIREEISVFNGQLVKFGADGVFAAFNTGVSAVSFTLKIQERIAGRNAKRPKAERFSVRVGIHLGDVMQEKNQLVGDAVNIATQIKPLADPGGVAMTDNVYYQVKNQIPLKGSFQSAGRVDIPEHMRVFLVPAVGKSFFLWNLKKHAGSTVAVLLAGAVAFSVTVYYMNRDTSRRMALMVLRTAGDADSAGMAQSIQEEVDQDFAGIPKIRWVSQEGVQYLFAQTSDPPTLEVGALEAARREGLNYILTCRLARTPEGRWKLKYRILSTSALTVAGAATLEGTDAESLAQELKRQVSDWADKAY